MQINLSVVVPLYYGKKYINQLVNYIEENCDFLNCKNIAFSIELILVNDSPKETLAATELPKSQLDIKLINNEVNKGIHASRIIGFNCTVGDWILFLDQDDVISGEMFYEVFQSIENNYEADAIVVNGTFRDNKVILNDSENKDTISNDELFPIIVSTGQVIIKKNSIPKPWIDNVLKSNYCDDAFLWLLMKAQNKQFVLCDKKLYVHTENGNNTSYGWENNIAALNEMISVINSQRLLEGQLLQYANDYLAEKVKKHNKLLETEKSFEYIITNKISFYKYINSYKHASIYGYGVFGKRLFELFQEMNIKIETVVDRCHESFQGDYQFDIVDINKIPGDIDLLIVTPIFDYDLIKSQLLGKTDATIVSLAEIPELM